MPDRGLGGWFGHQAANFFFHLPTFWTKNGLEAPHKPLSHVSYSKTEGREQQLKFEHICKDKIMTIIRSRSRCKVRSVEEEHVTNSTIILQNTSRTSKQSCEACGMLRGGPGYHSCGNIKGKREKFPKRKVRKKEKGGIY
jgi:hypothetical protein